MKSSNQGTVYQILFCCLSLQASSYKFLKYNSTLAFLFNIWLGYALLMTTVDVDYKIEGVNQ